MKKILLLEDDYDLAITIKEVLESKYKVDLATDAQEAIDKSFFNKYDLYIFDINVPKMSGIEILKSLKDAQDLTPTIFISAMVDLETIEKGFEAGAVDYIKKPFFPKELLLKVNLLLKENNETITYKNIKYNFSTKELFIDGKQVFLSYSLKCLFDIFIKNLDIVIDKEELLKCLTTDSNGALRVAITKLKSITNLDIQNIRGVGYIAKKS